MKQPAALIQWDLTLQAMRCCQNAHQSSQLLPLGQIAAAIYTEKDQPLILQCISFSACLNDISSRFGSESATASNAKWKQYLAFMELWESHAAFVGGSIHQWQGECQSAGLPFAAAHLVAAA